MSQTVERAEFGPAELAVGDMHAALQRRALTIVALYAAAAGAWIAVSDQLLGALVRDPETLMRISVFKGFAFIAATAAMLYGLLRATDRTTESAFEALRRTEADQRATDGARREAEAALRAAHDRLEATVAERTRELQAALARAEQADHLKSAFLATMSHELRTPLNSIIGFSGVLHQGLAGPLNAEQKKQLAMVCASADHLLALVNDVLDMSKIEAGQLRLDLERVSLAHTIARVVELVRPRAEAKGLSLEVELALGDGHVETDARRLEQVLQNLLSNALKFTVRGGVRLEARTELGQLLVRVSDTGEGIKSEDLERLFRPFSQVHAGLGRSHGGTGLGLSICQRLVELLGGRIWVKSVWGEGSTFGFELPVVRGTP